MPSGTRDIDCVIPAPFWSSLICGWPDCNKTSSPASSAWPVSYTSASIRFVVVTAPPTEKDPEYNATAAGPCCKLLVDVLKSLLGAGETTGSPTTKKPFASVKSDGPNVTTV